MPYLSLILFLIAPSAWALNCSSPPTDGWGSGYAAYASWCRACGGTPYKGAGVGCRPGPNWGGKSSSSSSSTYTPSVPVGNTWQEQAAYSMTSSFIQGFMSAQQPSAAELARQREQERLAEIERQRRLEEQRRERERKHKNLQSKMLNFKEPQTLKLKGDDVAVTGKIKLLRTESDPTVAPGNRIVDCQDTQARRDRIAAGLDVQRGAIARTRQQISAAAESAKASSADVRQKLRDKATEKLKGLALDSASDVKKIRQALQRLRKTKQVKAADYARFGKLAKELDTKIGETKKLAQAGKSGHAYGKKLNERASDLAAKLWETNQFLVDSGLAAEVGEALATAGGGPLGKAAFEVANTAIDIGASFGEGKIHQRELGVAKRNLAVMEEQLQRSETRVVELDQDLTLHCRE